MIKMMRYLKGYIVPIICAIVLLFVQANADLKLPDLMSKVVNEGIVNSDMNMIWQYGGIMLLYSLLVAACTIIVGYLAAKIGAGVSMHIRHDLFNKVESFSLTEFDRFGSSSLITRTTNDVQQVQMFIIMMLRIVIYAPIIGIGGVIRAIGKSPSMSWLIAVAVIVILGMILVVFAVVMPRFKLVQKMVDRLNQVTRESLTGMLVIRAFGNEKHEEQRFDKANSDLTKLNLFVNRSMSLMMPVMMLVMNLLTIAVTWVGAHAIGDGSLQIGDMMAFIQYAMQIIMAFLMVSMAFIMMPRASVSAQRISEVLSCEPVIRDPQSPKEFDTAKTGYVEFDHVSFSYPEADEEVLRDITFTARPGETTAFIGSTGSGKSTVVNLIPRFYDVQKGEIRVDGVNIKEVTQHSLHEKIGYVPQKGVLFSGTIAENLRFGKEQADDGALSEAAQIAQAEDFITEKPEGYETYIAQGGTNVSGGQKQRLSIARALTKRPEIYIFDDSFSALDFKTDAALRRALRAKTEGATVLIVAQRISTILDAEQIVVLDEGQIAGIGSHRELMQTCEIYREIALSQLGEEELA